MGRMTEEQLEHLIRASGAILNEDSILVIGSQSILPWLMKFASKNLGNIPEVLVASTEADIIPVDNDPQYLLGLSWRCNRIAIGKAASGTCCLERPVQPE